MPKYNMTNLSSPIPPPALSKLDKISRDVLRHSSIFESINVVPKTFVDFHTMRIDSFFEKNRVMDSLSSRDDFFSSTEHIVRVRILWIRGVGHGIEWTDVKGEFVEDI
jgi:hypothetical protein